WRTGRRLGGVRGNRPRRIRYADHVQLHGLHGAEGAADSRARGGAGRGAVADWTVWGQTWGRAARDSWWGRGGECRGGGDWSPGHRIAAHRGARTEGYERITQRTLTRNDMRPSP